MNDPVLEWLLEKNNPSVRYQTLRHLLKKPATDPEVQAARRAIMASEPVRRILAAQYPGGYWSKAGSGYSPKYKAGVWQILFLAEFGADGTDPRIRRGVEYLLTHAPASHGGFSCYQEARPSGAVHCLNGNLVWALGALGYGEDERVARAVDWLAGAITGDDFNAYYASGTSAPNFCCGANTGLPCAWGTVKALRALASLPRAQRSERVGKAAQMAADLLLSRDLAQADYPYPARVSGEWFRFGFPLSYTSDVLEALAVLGEAGYGRDPRLEHARDFVASQRGPDGRWKLRHSLNGKMWVDIEDKGKPSKWVTLRALRALSPPAA